MCLPDKKEAAYKYIVHPHLEYPSPAWSPHASRNITKKEAVQKRAARFVLNNYEYYGPNAKITEKIKTQLKWIPLQPGPTAPPSSFGFLQNKK